MVEVRPAGDETEIVVRDTGRGMPAETLRRIGTPFFTTRDDGTGLGVVLARSVIAQHGGSLRYESEPGRGTTVRVTFSPAGWAWVRSQRRRDPRRPSSLEVEPRLRLPVSRAWARTARSQNDRYPYSPAGKCPFCGLPVAPLPGTACTVSDVRS